MKKNIYLILLISSLLYQTLNSSMDHKQINAVSNPGSFAWVNDKTIAIANEESCYLLNLQKDNQPTTLHTGSSMIHCTFDNNQQILLSKVCNTGNKRELMVYDLKTKSEILPRLSERCFLHFLLADRLFFTSHATDNQQQHTIIDADNQEFTLPISRNMRAVASNGNDLLFVPINTDNRPLTKQKWTLVDLELPTQPKIKELCPTFLKDPKNVFNAFFSHDRTYIAFNTLSYNDDNAPYHQWFIYNCITDTLSTFTNCIALKISPNNSTAAYLSNEHKNEHKIVFFDIKLDQTICSLPFTTKYLSGSKLEFSPNGTQIAILSKDQYCYSSQLFLLDVPTEALNPPSLKAICTRLLLLKSYQYDHINILPNELVSLIMKKLASVFGYPVRA